MAQNKEITITACTFVLFHVILVLAPLLCNTSQVNEVMEIHGCLQGWAVTRLRAVGFLLWTPGVIIREVQGIQIRKKIKRKENEDTLTAYMIRASRNFSEPLKFTMLLRPRGRHVLRSLCVNSRGSAIHSHFPAVQVEKAFFAPPSSPGAGWRRRFSLHTAVTTASSPRPPRRLQ